MGMQSHFFNIPTFHKIVISFNLIIISIMVTLIIISIRVTLIIISIMVNLGVERNRKTNSPVISISY